jgi:hypothetical protein
VKRILYAGWLGFNNVGDELMWLLFRDLCRKHLPSKEYDVIPSIPGIDIRNFSAYDTVVLGGGSLLEPGYIDVAYQAAMKGKKLLIWGSGYDRQQQVKLDEAGRALESLAYTGAHQETNGKLAAAVKHALYCGVRGPLSFQFLQNAGAPTDKAIISGDPGLLLPRPGALPTVEKQAAADGGHAGSATAGENRGVLPTFEKQAAVDGEHAGSAAAGGNPGAHAAAGEASGSGIELGRKLRTIGVNWGTAYNRIFGGNEEQVENQLAKALRQLLAEGYAVHVYPVWGPDREACKRLCGKLNGHPRVTYDPTLYHHEDLLEQLQTYALTINFKLHANFLSAAAGVPFICLGYRFKALDFGWATGLQQYVLTTDDERLSEHILERAARIEQERESIVARFFAAQARSRALLEQPFVEGLL